MGPERETAKPSTRSFEDDNEFGNSCGAGFGDGILGNGDGDSQITLQLCLGMSSAHADHEAYEDYMAQD